MRAVSCGNENEHLDSIKCAEMLYGLKTYCCITKAMVEWERRMWEVLTEREVLSALEHLRIEIKDHSSTR